jgi:hypothetical protein
MIKPVTFHQWGVEVRDEDRRAFYREKEERTPVHIFTRRARAKEFLESMAGFCAGARRVLKIKIIVEEVEKR